MQRIISSNEWAGALLNLMPKDYDYDKASIDEPKTILKIISAIMQAPEVETSVCKTSGDIHIKARWKDGEQDEISDLFLKADAQNITNFFVGSDCPKVSSWIFGMEEE